MEHDHYGRYRLVRPLGEGGMASVHLAEDPLLRRPVALKRLHRELGTRPEWVRRFHTEATAVSNLGNPHVVQVFDLGRDHEEDYLVMELVEGISLGGLMLRQDGPFPPDAAAAIAVQAASGLAAAHEAAVVHRDIKPDNLLVRKDGTVKVADFGIARLTEEISRTMTGTVMGSPLYMAPEQIEGKTPTGALDVFALGAVLYRMLAGRAPFEAEHSHAVMWRIVSEPAPPLGQIVPGLDPALVDFVDLLLRKDPLQRPTAAATARTLRQFLSAGGIADPVDFVRARVLPEDVRRAAPLSASPKLVGGTLPDATPRPSSAAPSRAPETASKPGGRMLLLGALAAGFLALGLAGLAASRLLGGASPKTPEAPAADRPVAAAEAAKPARPAAAAPSGTPAAAPTDAAASTEASPLVVLARDEAPEDLSSLKPRLSFRNEGSATIAAFRATWDIPGDAARHPVVESYWSPGCRSRVEPRQGGLSLVVECSELQLRPGQIHPNTDGLSLGVHYPDWARWDGKPSLGLGRKAAKLPVRVEILR